MVLVDSLCFAAWNFPALEISTNLTAMMEKKTIFGRVWSDYSPRYQWWAEILMILADRTKAARDMTVSEALNDDEAVEEIAYLAGMSEDEVTRKLKAAWGSVIVSRIFSSI